MTIEDGQEEVPREHFVFLHEMDALQFAAKMDKHPALAGFHVPLGFDASDIGQGLASDLIGHAEEWAAG